MEKMKVSVIIPVYNAEKYIRDCMDSLLAQSLKEIEIICVNDGSTDHSPKIIEDYKRENSNILLIHQKNSYAGVARNRGLRYAKGEYVIFLDADDFFEPYFLEGMYRKAKKNAADLCICGARFYHEQTKQVTEAAWILDAGMAENREVFAPKEAAAYLYNFVTPAPWNKMFRRKYILSEGLQFQNTKRSNDLYFVYSAMSVAKRIVLYCRKPVYYRIGMSASLQAMRTKTPMDCIYALLKLKEELVKRKLFKIFEKSYVNMALSVCLYNLSDECGILLDAVTQLGVRGHGRDYFYKEEEYDQYLHKNQRSLLAGPFISVIIPMYQKEQVIARCLDSVLEQTLCGLEIVIVDDGSSDGGCRVVKKYRKSFSNIFLFRQKNQGVGAARNTGMHQARGKYLVFLDADDMVPYDAYEKMYQLAERKAADVVVGNICWGENGAELAVMDWLADLFVRYQNRNCARKYEIPLRSPSVCNKMMRRSLIHKTKLAFSKAGLAEDLEFSVRLFRAADRIYMLNEIVYQYITGGGPNDSLTKTTSASVVDSGLMVMKKLLLFFERQGLYQDEEWLIRGPVAWLWDRFWQIDPEEDKQIEFSRFQDFVRCCGKKSEFQEAVLSVFKFSAEEFVSCSYITYLEMLRNQSPEQLVLKKLQSTQLGFRYILQCFHTRIRYKVRSGCKRFRIRGRC